MKFLKELNKEQYLAATSFNGPILILAGAGSGKTKTLIARTANLIVNKVNPESILVITFTNKAAKEMRDRGSNLLKEINYQGKQPYFTTFHSWGYRFLRTYIDYNQNYKVISKNFTIADDNLQNKIVEQFREKIFQDNISFKLKHFSSLVTIMQNNLIPYKSVKETYEAILNLFEKKKERKRLFKENHISNNREVRKLAELYIKYKEELRKNNLVDFDDLINLPIEILEEDQKIRNFLRNKYEYIMVDEFQDTNWAQIKLLNQLLNPKKQNICVVGDDSQSIYSWRGADIEYILSFHKKYEEVLKINLTKNYRSTKEIVGHANKLIENANEKHEFKEALKAFKKEKGKIETLETENEYDEARKISYKIRNLITKKIQPKDIAILYRNNFISLSLEKELIKNHIPYQIYKGKALLQKKAIQEYMNHIALFLNPKNSVALEICLTSTSKILSPKKLDEMKIEAKSKKITLEEYIFNEKWKNIKLTKPQINKLNSFIYHTKEMRKLLKNKDFVNEEFLIKFYQDFPLIKEHERIREETKSIKTKEQAEKALADINMINSIIMSYKTIEEFMEAISLNSETEESEENKVTLMTIHASKGLEFSYVFLARMNQGVIPSMRSVSNAALLEEERRLAYVGITRAKKFLHISFVRKQRYENLTPSIFLFESGLLK